MNTVSIPCRNFRQTCTCSGKQWDNEPVGGASSFASLWDDLRVRNPRVHTISPAWKFNFGSPSSKHKRSGISATCVLSHFSRVWPSVTPWTVALQAPLSMDFSRQEYWSGLPCPPPGDLPDPGIKSTSLMSPALAGGFLTTSVSWEAPVAAEQRCPT